MNSYEEILSAFTIAAEIADSWSGDKTSAPAHTVAVRKFELPLAIVITYKYSAEEI